MGCSSLFLTGHIACSYCSNSFADYPM
uniref:Uncharacterized protein n=1 Tax=Rhizophora mucronata TaxID=61149 RepID=A0A2P2QVP8_RHIMU